MVDAFVGTWEVESRDNYDAFMKGVGVPDEYIEMGRKATVVTEFSVNGDMVTVTRKRPHGTVTNSFQLGKEAEIDTIKGEKIKAVINMEGGKLITRGQRVDKYEVVAEIVGGKMKETITAKGHTMSRTSVRK